MGWKLVPAPPFYKGLVLQRYWGHVDSIAVYKIKVSDTFDTYINQLCPNDLQHDILIETFTLCPGRDTRQTGQSFVV